MSTKIYNGYKLPLMTINRFNEFVLAFQKIVEKKNNERMMKLMMERMVEMVDDYVLESKETFEKRYLNMEGEEKTLKEVENIRLFRKIYQDIKEEYLDIKRTNERNAEVDFDTSMSVFPLKDKILLLLYTEDGEVLTCLEKMEQISYYGYWDNTDPDENCTEEEWERRKKDWDEALPGLGIPKETGMTISISENLPRMSDIQSVDYKSLMPTFEERLNIRARDKTAEKVFWKLKEKEPSKSDMRLTIEAYRKIREGEYKEIFDEEKEKLKKILVQNIQEPMSLTFGKLEELKKQIVK